MPFPAPVDLLGGVSEGRARPGLGVGVGTVPSRAAVGGFPSSHWRRHEGDKTTLWLPNLHPLPETGLVLLPDHSAGARQLPREAQLQVTAPAAAGCSGVGRTLQRQALAGRREEAKDSPPPQSSQGANSKGEAQISTRLREALPWAENVKGHPGPSICGCHLPASSTSQQAPLPLGSTSLQTPPPSGSASQQTGGCHLVDSRKLPLPVAPRRCTILEAGQFIVDGEKNGWVQRGCWEREVTLAQYLLCWPGSGGMFTRI